MSEPAPAAGGFDTEEMTLNMGPQHPSTHGVLRFVVKADGEVMSEAIPDVGYLHRSIEKIAEKVELPRLHAVHRPRRLRRRHVLPTRLVHGGEKLAGIEVPGAASTAA